MGGGEGWRDGGRDHTHIYIYMAWWVLSMVCNYLMYGMFDMYGMFGMYG